MSTDSNINMALLKIMGGLGAASHPVSRHDVWTALADEPSSDIERNMRELVGGYGNDTLLAYLNEMAHEELITNHGGGMFSF